MRTTVDIADDLLAEAKVLAARTNRSLSAVVNDSLCSTLRRNSSGTPAGEWTFPTGGTGGLRPGVNLDDKEALADLLDDNDLP